MIRWMKNDWWRCLLKWHSVTYIKQWQSIMIFTWMSISFSCSFLFFSLLLWLLSITSLHFNLFVDLTKHVIFNCLSLLFFLFFSYAASAALYVGYFECHGQWQKKRNSLTKALANAEKHEMKWNKWVHLLFMLVPHAFRSPFILPLRTKVKKIPMMRWTQRHFHTEQKWKNVTHSKTNVEQNMNSGRERI